MKPHHPGLDLLYGLLATLIVAQGTWWVIFQTREGARYERVEVERLESELRHARSLVAIAPDATTSEQLRDTFPELSIERRPDGVDVEIDPEVLTAVRAEARRRSRMFLLEGTFFLALLGAGTLVLGLAHRAESRFRRSREVLLAGITHEFRTPLASLRLWTETLERDDLDEAARARIRPKLLEDVGRLEALVSQVLAAGRGGDMDRRLFEPLDAGREAADVLAEMEGYLTMSRARVAADLPPGHVFLGQRVPFAVALRNLVQNAAKYSPAPAKIDLSLSREGRWIRLAVHDDGPGIARVNHERIFESFTRLEDGDRPAATSTHGAGLGLFLVKRNVEAMGGRVELVSELGRGSTFTLVLPAQEASA
jgi:signal transduction histidine kinase